MPPPYFQNEKDMEDKMVELTRFVKVSEAEMLANLLKSEGIDCYVRDSFISEIYQPVDFGGAKVELLEKDLQRAREIMEVFGFNKKSDEDEDENTNPVIEETSEPVETNKDTNSDTTMTVNDAKSKANLSRTMMIFILLILLVFVLMVMLHRYYNG